MEVRNRNDPPVDRRVVGVAARSPASGRPWSRPAASVDDLGVLRSAIGLSAPRSRRVSASRRPPRLRPRRLGVSARRDVLGGGFGLARRGGFLGDGLVGGDLVDGLGARPPQRPPRRRLRIGGFLEASASMASAAGGLVRRAPRRLVQLRPRRPRPPALVGGDPRRSRRSPSAASASTSAAATLDDLGRGGSPSAERGLVRATASTSAAMSSAAGLGCLGLGDGLASRRRPRPAASTRRVGGRLVGRPRPRPAAGGPGRRRTRGCCRCRPRAPGPHRDIE